MGLIATLTSMSQEADTQAVITRVYDGDDLAAIIWTRRIGVISPKDFDPVKARTGSTKIIDTC